MNRRRFVQGSAILGLGLTTPPPLLRASGMYLAEQDRRVHAVLGAQRVNVGTLPVLRVFAGDQRDYVSPYVLFDEFGPVDVAAGADPLRVDAHPHAGVAPTTYFLAGTGHHRDSLDYDFQIGRGDFMVFSSGRGAVHMEESGQRLRDEGGAYHGFQIWLNTPAKHKHDAPLTHVFRESDMDVVTGEGHWVKVVLGQLGEARSNVQTHAPAFYYHVRLDADARLDIPTDPTHNAFAYLISGDLEVEGARRIRANETVLYERGGREINLYSEGGAELLVLGGQPLDEPVYSYGPFVMSSEDEIRACFKRYRAGEMGDPNVVDGRG